MQRNWKSQNKSEKAQAGRIILSDFKSYYIAIVTRTVWYWYRINTQINGTENRVQKSIHEYKDNRFLTKVQRQFSGERIFF